MFRAEAVACHLCWPALRSLPAGPWPSPRDPPAPPSLDCASSHPRQAGVTAAEGAPRAPPPQRWCSPSPWPPTLWALAELPSPGSPAAMLWGAAGAGGHCGAGTQRAVAGRGHPAGRETWARVSQGPHAVFVGRWPFRCWLSGTPTGTRGVRTHTCECGLCPAGSSGVPLTTALRHKPRLTPDTHRLTATCGPPGDQPATRVGRATLPTTAQTPHTRPHAGLRPPAAPRNPAARAGPPGLGSSGIPVLTASLPGFPSLLRTAPPPSLSAHPLAFN